MSGGFSTTPPPGILPGRSVIPANLIAPRPDTHASDRDRSLGHGIHHAVDPRERGDEQRTPLQACCVTHRRHDHIDFASLFGKSRNRGGHHHRGDIAQAEVILRHIDAKPLQHARYRLEGKRGSLRIPRPVEPHHEAVADDLLTPNALHVGDVLYADCAGSQCAAQQHHHNQRSHNDAIPFHARLT